MENFPCTNCQKPFNLPDPAPRILRDAYLNSIVYLQPPMACPHCGQIHSFQVVKVDVISATWVPASKKEKSHIISPPGGFDPNPKIM